MSEAVTEVTEYPTNGEELHGSAPDVRVGDVVLVPMDPASSNGSSEAPAVVVRVWSPDLVNVQVWPDAHESAVWRTSCNRVVEFAEGAINVWRPLDQA